MEARVRRRQESNDQLLTVYVPDAAVTGYVLRFTDTGLEARVDGPVPRDERFRFILHLREGVVAGEVTCVGQEDALCRLQFMALTARDRARLEPLIDET